MRTEDVRQFQIKKLEFVKWVVRNNPGYKLSELAEFLGMPESKLRAIVKEVKKEGS